MASPCPHPRPGSLCQILKHIRIPLGPQVFAFALPASIHVSKPHLVVVNLPVSLGLLSNFSPSLLFKCFVQVQHTDVYSSITFHRVNTPV